MADSGFRTILLHESGTAQVATAAEIYEPPRSGTRPATFLFLPFWGGSADTYSQIQRSLGSKCADNASIAISYRGTGKACLGDDSDNEPARHSIELLTADLLHFLRSPEVGQIANVSSLIICAHSMSAKIALRLACTLDLNSGIRVQSLLLLAPAPPGPLVLPPEVRQGQLTAYESYDSAMWTIANILSYKQLDGSVAAQLADACASMSPGAKKGWIEIGMAESITDLIENVSVEKRRFPVMVMAGRCDKVETMPRVEEETVAFLKHCGFEVRLVELEDCGHLIPLERPGAVVEQLVAIVQ
ncbi:hypothetical protein G7Y79_00001g004280 [Physcia stellaris]|nr:hypothetical protein G7Y79_00001g004280 [Physcia stellaris]